MIILGIDPGTTACGYGVVKQEAKTICLDYGVFKISASGDIAERLAELQAGVEKLIQQWRPSELAVEELFFAKNRKTALAVAQARGVALAAGGRAGLKVSGYKPAQIKLAVCGYGAATKEQMQKMVKLSLGMKELPEPDDAADGLAVALTHLQHQKQSGFLSQ